MRDHYRPTHEPARSIYDAIVKESDERPLRTLSAWKNAERRTAHGAAIAAAQKHGLTMPTMTEIDAAERHARGHTDYAAKWAYAITSAMKKDTNHA